MQCLQTQCNAVKYNRILTIQCNAMPTIECNTNQYNTSNYNTIPAITTITVQCNTVS